MSDAMGDDFARLRAGAAQQQALFEEHLRRAEREVVPPGVELEVAVLPPRPVALRPWRVRSQSIRDRRNRHEERTRWRGRV